MLRSRFLLSILIFASLLAGCAVSANVQLEENKTANNISTSTEVSEQSSSVELAKSEILPEEPPANCPVTQAPDSPFMAPAPYPPTPPERYTNQFWYGTPELWTMLGIDGTWSNLPHNQDGYSQKVFWWSQDFHVSTDPYPAFTLSIERLDANTPSSPMVVSKEAINASADFGTAMLTGVTVAEPGCWKITGQYEQAELSFIVWVAP